MAEPARAPGVDGADSADKPSPEYSTTPGENSETSADMPPSSKQNQAPEPDSPASDKAPSGAPLDRVPSQAQKLGKKKIFAVMSALCVGLQAVCHCDVDC